MERCWPIVVGGSRGSLELAEGGGRVCVCVCVCVVVLGIPTMVGHSENTPLYLQKGYFLCKGCTY